ncbi:MAG: hypothetical protein Q8Q33_08375 [Chlamydiota bacterium]|nr:hypothetical protein [Chlamydiota bacterium]
MKQAVLKKIAPKQFTLFKIKNRKGYAAICLNNLTESRTAAQAFSRLKFPLRRMGYVLPDKIPASRIMR